MASKSLKVLTQDLVEKKKVLTDLFQERAVVCNKARYEELIRPGGIIRKAELEVQEARDRLQKRIKGLTGLYAYTFKDLI
jgi:hypothetical protein